MLHTSAWRCVPLDTPYQSGRLSGYFKASLPLDTAMPPPPWVHSFLINPEEWAVPLICPRGTFPDLGGQEGPIIAQFPPMFQEGL